MFKKFVVGYDHRGEKKLEVVKQILTKSKVNFVVADCTGKDYIEATNLCVNAFNKDKNTDGMLLICGTGVGVCMAANKHKNMRAVLANTNELAYFARRHENANCLCLGAGYEDGIKKITLSNAKLEEIISTFISTEFEAGRHLERVAKLNKCED